MSLVANMSKALLGGNQKTANVLLEGQLYRLGGVFKDWTTRWVTLSPNAIMYYSAKGKPAKMNDVLAADPQSSQQNAICIYLTMWNVFCVNCM
jgi:hypothetical protein